MPAKTPSSVLRPLSSVLSPPRLIPPPLSLFSRLTTHNLRVALCCLNTHQFVVLSVFFTSMTSRSNVRRRQTLRDSHAQANSRNGDTMTPKVINAAPSLEKAELYGIHDQRPTFSKLMGLAGRIFIETIPQWLTVAAMLSLIFGGCCSNVSSNPPMSDLGLTD